MGRPYVKINAKNQIKELSNHLEGIFPKLKSLSGVIGITLNGGLSRGFADHLSEIDLSIYLDSVSYQEWQEKKSPIPLGIVKFDDVLYDIKIIDFDTENGRIYNHVELWDLSYAKILFDPQGKVAELHNDKLSRKPNISEAEGLLFGAWWNFRLAGDIWISRGDILQGHFMFNESVTLLIKALFIANGEYIPHEKWLIHMSRSLDWRPKDWETRLGDAMGTGDLSLNSLVCRQSCIESLWSEIDNYIKDKYYPGFPLHIMQKSFYDLLKFLVEKETIPVEEWKQKGSIAMLHEDPFHKVIEIHDDKIVFDKGKLLALKPEDIYSWHDEVLRGVISDLK